jgi:hypothetical protein
MITQAGTSTQLSASLATVEEIIINQANSQVAINK